MDKLLIWLSYSELLIPLTNNGLKALIVPRSLKWPIDISASKDQQFPKSNQSAPIDLFDLNFFIICLTMLLH